MKNGKAVWSADIEVTSISPNLDGFLETWRTAYDGHPRHDNTSVDTVKQSQKDNLQLAYFDRLFIHVRSLYQRV